MGMHELTMAQGVPWLIIAAVKLWGVINGVQSALGQPAKWSTYR